MENLEQEKISKVKSKFEKEHTKISVFLRYDQIEYLNKEHIEPNGSNMSLVVRNAVDTFIEKDKNEKLAILKKVAVSNLKCNTLTKGNVRKWERDTSTCSQKTE